MTTDITDEDIQRIAATARPLSIALLSWAEGRSQEGADAIELEHQRRMVGLKQDRTIVVLAPVQSEGLCGVALLDLPVAEATELMAGDPCVQAGMMTVEVHPCAAFPGDVVPGVAEGEG